MKILDLTQLQLLDLDSTKTWMVVDVDAVTDVTRRLRLDHALTAAVGYPPVIYVKGSLGAGPSIDWTVRVLQQGTLTANATVTFVNPSTPCHLTLQLTQDGTGGRTVSWPTLLGDTPQVNTTENSVTIVNLYFDGTNYHSFA